MGKKETQFYVDKPLTEMELPRMIVCYKEGSYHIIKDISVDEGLHSFDTILVGNSVKDKEVYNESDFARDGFTNEHQILGALKSSSLNGQPTSDVNSEDTENISSGSLPEECEDMSHTIDEIVYNDSHENFDEFRFPPQESESCQCEEQSIDVHNKNAKLHSLASLLEEDRQNTSIAREIVHAFETKGVLPIQELDRGHYQGDASNSTLDLPHLANSDIHQSQSVSFDSLDSESTKSDSHQPATGGRAKLPSISSSIPQSSSAYNGNGSHQVDEGALEDNSTTSGVSSGELKEENKTSNSLSSGDSGINAVSIDINSGRPATVINKDSKGPYEIQQSVLLTSGSMLEETSSNAPTSSWTSFGHGHVNSNFLGPASLSGRIAYSGQMPYSGSISLRSDSSTTSTRSFAFPILQSEWNSSPVRMAKADRRHFRKRQGWRSGLFCCRF